MSVSSGGPALVITLVCACALVLVVAGLMLLPHDRGPVEGARIGEIDAYRALHPDAGEITNPDVTAKPGPIPAPERDETTRAMRRRARLAERLDCAGMTITVTRWSRTRLGIAVAATALWYLLLGSLVVAALIGAALAWAATEMYLRRKITVRQRAFTTQMPDVMQLVASSLRSGFSLTQALDAAARQGTEPTASELGRALTETRLDVDLEDALDKVAKRMQCSELAWATMAMRISRQVGGNLAEVLMTTVNTMRERAILKRQVRSLSAEGRLSAYILVALPICIGLWLFLVRRDYVRPLYTTGAGIGMLVAAVLAIAVGSWWLSRVVKVEV